MKQKVAIVIPLLIMLLFGNYYSLKIVVKASNMDSANIEKNKFSETAKQAEADEGLVLDFGNIDESFTNNLKQYEEFMPASYGGSMGEFIKSSHMDSFPALVKGLLRFTIKEFFSSWQLLGSLIVLTVFSAVLQTVQSSFEKTTVSKISSVVIIMMILLVALNSFRISGNYVVQTITALVDFLMAMIPFFLALVATSGGVITSGFFHPVLYFVMNVTVLIIQYIVIPLLLISTIVGVINELSEQYNFSELCKWLRSISVWLLGILFTVSLSVLSIQGVFTAVSDGVGAKSVKFVTSNFIPVVGKMFSEVTDTIIGASTVLKNTLGVAGLIIIFLLVAFPAIKILMIATIYRLAVIILQPIGQSQVIKSLNWISKNLYYMLGSYLLVGVMFFLALTIMVLSSNVILMVR